MNLIQAITSKTPNVPKKKKTKIKKWILLYLFNSPWFLALEKPELPCLLCFRNRLKGIEEEKGGLERWRTKEKEEETIRESLKAKKDKKSDCQWKWARGGGGFLVQKACKQQPHTIETWGRVALKSYLGCGPTHTVTTNDVLPPSTQTSCGCFFALSYVKPCGALAMSTMTLNKKNWKIFNFWFNRIELNYLNYLS